VDVQQAKAVPVNPITVLMANIVSMIENIGDELANTDNLAETIETLVWNMAQAALKIIADNAIVIAKYLALLAVQKATTALIGGGNGLLIRDWNNYLYTSPHKQL